MSDKKENAPSEILQDRAEDIEAERMYEQLQANGSNIFNDPKATLAERDAEIKRLRERVKRPKRVQPCGCVLCFCADEQQCHGCGAKSCPNHDCDVRKGILVDEDMRCPNCYVLDAEVARLRAEVEKLKDAFGDRVAKEEGRDKP